MTTQEIADRLIELCRQGNYQQAQEELYHKDAESIEPEGTPGGNAKGMDAIAEKGKQWAGSVEAVHGNEISEPMIAGDHICLKMTSDITMKGMDRMSFEELCLYQVKDGKIIKEQFFYPVG